MWSQRVTGLVGALVVVLAMPSWPAYAADPVTDLYVAVAADGGLDSNPCTSELPCATVQHAVDAADPSGTTVHVAAGTFDAAATVTKDVAITGAGTDQTTLVQSADTAFGVVMVYAGTTTLSGMTIHGGFGSPLLVDDTGHAVADGVVLDGGNCSLAVGTGEADLTDSVLQNGGHGPAGCSVEKGTGGLWGDIGIVSGTVSLVRSQVLSPESLNAPGVRMTGGTFSADQTVFDDTANQTDTATPFGVDVRGGSAEISRSSFHAFLGGVVSEGGTATVSDSTFFDNQVGVSASAGSALVVRSSFQHELGSVQTYGTGTLSVAGSVFGTDSIRNCTGTITDLGYNLATDASCGLTGTSHDGVAGLNLDTGLADWGGPLPTLAILDPSSAVDTIPAGATYGAGQPLCPASGTTDLRGVPRPQAGACDAGSMELAATTTTLVAPVNATPGHDVDLQAEVTVAGTGVDGVGVPAGTVTFRAGSVVLCADVPVAAGEAGCTVSPPEGRVTLSATFEPTPGSTLHPSASGGQPMLTASEPKASGPHRVVVRVGRKATVVLRGSGEPAPRFIVVSGTAPKGMRIARGTGTLTISGRPHASALGRHRIEVRATNVIGSVTRTVTIVVRRR